MQNELTKWLFMDLGSTLIDEDEYLLRRDALLFDLISGVNGTLSHEEYRLTLKETKAKLPHSVSKAILHYYIPESVVQEHLYYFYKRQLQPYSVSLRRPYPDTFSVLPLLSRYINLGVIADQGAWVRQALEKDWHLSSFFKVIVLSEEVGFEKPDLRFFELALSQANSHSQAAIMLGDRPDKDIAPAKALGMSTIRIRRGLDFQACRPRNKSEEADVEIDCLAEILALLNG